MFRIALAISLSAAVATGATASEPQYLWQTSSTANTAQIEIAGSGNLLQIVQDFHSAGGGNAITVEIVGSGNGGPEGYSFSGAALAPELRPGTLMQAGHDNAMTISVKGTGNLFGFAQIGSHNSLTGAVAGSYNQAVVLQTGTGNVTNFSQTGVGNSLSVTQRSW